MKLPFSFDLKFIFRVILPGFIASLGFIPALELLILTCQIRMGLEYFIFFLAIILGWFLLISDMHLYMFLGGRRYWPASIRKFFISRKSKRLAKLLEDAEEAYNEWKKLDSHSPARSNWYNRYIELSVKARNFPVDKKGERKVMFPTRFGNLLYSYESYPKIVYGMDSVFYWYRIWLKLDKDLRQHLDSQQGLADSTVYTTISLAGIGILFFIYAIVSWATTLFANYIIQGKAFILISCLCFILSYAVYSLCLQVHSSYGNLFKSMFDQFRDTVHSDHIIQEIERLHPNLNTKKLSSRKKYSMVWEYLHNYRINIQRDSHKSIMILLEEVEKK